MRTLFTLLWSSLALVAAESLAWTDEVNLDQAGALDRAQPEHVHAIRQILRQAPQRKPHTLASWIRADFGAGDAAILIIKASDPPQAALAFTLGDTRYRATVILENAKGRVIPLG